VNRIATLCGKPSADIAGSKIGIGFECLDRRMWDDTDEAYRLVGALGVKHARVQSGWSRCEEEREVFTFAWLDRIVDKLLEQGVQPWFNVGYGNIHHTGAEEPDAVGWAPIYSEESRAAWTNYVAALVQHFRDRVTHYEVWNEPDIDPFWVTGSKLADYMDLLRLTVPVIREHAPEARILGGATAAGFSPRGFATLEEYLKAGFAQLIDVYTYHRYRIVPELYSADDMVHIRSAFAAYGGERIELWQAESGCPSQSATTQALANTPVDREVQAKVLCRSIMTDLAMGVDYTCWFHFSDFKFYYRNGFCDVPNHFGVVTFDDPPQRKPSYYALQRICALFDDDTVREPRTKLDMSIPDMNKSRDRYAFQADIVNTCMAAFQRKGYPLVSWYMPADLLPAYAGNEPYKPRDVNLHMWTPAGRIEQPVVIDLMTGGVHEPKHRADRMGRDDISEGLLVTGVPLNDYPTILTDRRAVDDVIAADA
jgi:hypothetical protein